MERIRIELLGQYPLRVKRSAGFVSSGQVNWRKVENQGSEITEHVARQVVKETVKDVEMRLANAEEQQSISFVLFQAELQNKIAFTEAEFKRKIEQLDTEIEEIESRLGTPDKMEGLEKEKSALQNALRNRSKLRSRTTLKQAQSDIHDLEYTIYKERRKLELAKEFNTNELPKRREELSKAITKLRTKRVALTSNIDIFRRDIISLEQQEQRLRELATIFIQAFFRGVRVRRCLRVFKMDQENLRVAGKLLCRKLALHIPVIQQLFLHRDCLDHALEPELTCRYCYQAFSEPVWICSGTHIGKTFCKSCILEIAQDDIIETKRTGKQAINPPSFIRNHLLEDLQQKSKEKNLVYREVSDRLDILRSELLLLDEYETLFSNGGLTASHLSNRLKQL